MIKKIAPIFRAAGRLLRWLNPLRLLRLAGRVLLALRNLRRSLALPEYVLIDLPGDMPPLPQQRGWLQRRLLGDPPLSLSDLEQMLRQIAADPRPEGVVLFSNGFNLSLANLQTLRGSIERLRAAGKRVLFWSQSYDTATYFVASACDEILLQPGGDLFTVGLHREALFLKDALDIIGVSLDVIAISPYKSAFDQFARSAISDEARAQIEWLLESEYELLVSGIAQGRGLTPDAVRAMIDTAPYLDTEALAAGYVDALLNEEQLVEHLKDKQLVHWDDAERQLYLKAQPRTPKVIALLNVSGLITQGESTTPPGGIPLPVPLIGEGSVGDLNLVRQVRDVLRDDSVAAVILYIDSPGGSAAAAEAMTSALAQLAKTRPLIACMNSEAASAGYYIATPAQWIIAQPGTITGSIGVILAKPVIEQLQRNLLLNSVDFRRGVNASLMSITAPFSDDQRATMQKLITHSYRQFVERVAAARGMTFEQVDAVGGGRVWTGAQAQAHGLVDQLGDLHAALAKARELANVSEDTPLVLVHDRGKPVVPQAAEALNPAAYYGYLQRQLQALGGGRALLLLPFLWRK